MEIAGDIIGSYEEAPPTIVDLAARDRRWAQGNIQQIQILLSKGFDWLSNTYGRIIYGLTNYAIGLSGARIVEAVLRDEGAILPVSSVLEDYHGVNGIALSVPSVVDAQGVSQVIEMPFSVHEEQQLHRSVEAITASLRELGL